MDLYIYVEGEDLDKIVEPVSASIMEWVGDRTEGLNLVNRQDENTLRLGINITINEKSKLKKPLNFLYKIAKEHKCDFVIGIFCPDTGDMEDVCYFGHEEGRPDMFEVANYLEL